MSEFKAHAALWLCVRCVGRTPDAATLKSTAQKRLAERQKRLVVVVILGAAMRCNERLRDFSWYDCGLFSQQVKAMLQRLFA